MVTMKRKRKSPFAPDRRPDWFGNIASSGPNKLVSCSVGALPILNSILERVRLEEFLKEYVVEDARCKIPPSRGILLLVRNYIVSREPVYGVGEWAQEHAAELVGLSAGQSRILNDDRVGRCLDRLFEADYSSLALAVVAHVVKEFCVDLDELHNDSTTITLYGEYQEASQERKKRGKTTRMITFGHSKDHRPDLKQLLYNLTVSADGAVPVHFFTGNGNLTDDKTHRATWDLLCKLTGRTDFLYVADSKLATKANMAYIARRGGRFVSVLPRSRAEDKAFRKLVVDQVVSWKEVHRKVDDDGAIVDLFSLSEHAATTVEGYRLLWFHSTRKEEQDKISRNSKIQRTLNSLADLRSKLRSPRTRYRQRPSVEEAVEKRLAKLGATEWITVKVLEADEDRYRQARPGRPGKGTKYVRMVRRRFDIQYEVNFSKVAEDALCDGIFPLVTNDGILSDVEILLAYKKQPLIEKRFSQLKTDYEVAPVYLKSVSRIEALLCVYFFALLIEALLERELRLAMELAGKEVLALYPEGRPCRAPTTRRIVDVFANIQRHTLDMGGQRTEFTTKLSPIQAEVLELLALEPETYGH